MHGVFLTILSLVFVVLWSSGWVVSRFAVVEINFIALLCLRYLIVAGVIGMLLAVTGSWRKIKRINIRAHLLIGLLCHASYLLAGVGAFELGVSAGLVAFVAALQPMLTAVMSRFASSESITVRQWQGLIIGLCAVLLLVSESYQQGIAGYALILPFIGVLALSMGTLVNRQIELSNQLWRRKPDPILPAMFVHCVGALSILIPMCVIHQPDSYTLNTEQWLVILWLALVVSLGAYALLLLLLRHMSAMRVSSLSYLIPPATMMQAWFVFGDSISSFDVAALTLVAISLILILKPVKKSGVATVKASVPCNIRLVDIEL